MKKTLAIASSLLALTIAGCAGDPEIDIERNAALGTIESSTSSNSAQPSLPDVAAFGDTVTFADGMTVTIQSGGLRPASAYAAGAVDDKIATVQITVVNNGDTPVDAAGVSALSASAGDEGISAPSAADEGIDNPTLGKILPGEKRTAVFGFGLSAADAQSLRLKISGNDFSDSAVFAGSVQ